MPGKKSSATKSASNVPPKAQSNEPAPANISVKGQLTAEDKTKAIKIYHILKPYIGNDMKEPFESEEKYLEGFEQEPCPAGEILYWELLSQTVEEVIKQFKFSDDAERLEYGRIAAFRMIAVTNFDVSKPNQAGWSDIEKRCVARFQQLLKENEGKMMQLKQSTRANAGLETYCDQCNAYGLNKKCTGCGLVYYCSRECQKESWKTHKDACQQVQALKKKLADPTQEVIPRPKVSSNSSSIASVVSSSSSSSSQ